MKKFYFIILVISFNLIIAQNCLSQVTDYRDAFLGLYHSSTPPCINGNEQTPPNHYVLIQKDTLNVTGIIVTDTMWSDPTPPTYEHPCTLNQNDSTYYDGTQDGKFVPTDSLKIIVPGVVCGGGFGGSYYLKKIAPVGLFTLSKREREWYMFPNPAVNELNIVLPCLTEEMNLLVLDINGKLVLEQKFKTTTQIDVGTLPKGVYIVRIKGVSINLSKRVVLVN